jgi:hypothetical protein
MNRKDSGGLTTSEDSTYPGRGVTPVPKVKRVVTPANSCLFSHPSDSYVNGDILTQLTRCVFCIPFSCSCLNGRCVPMVLELV